MKYTHTGLAPQKTTKSLNNFINYIKSGIWVRDTKRQMRVFDVSPMIWMICCRSLSLFLGVFFVGAKYTSDELWIITCRVYMTRMEVN